ncbi:MAG: hypothetical protein D6679_11135 [Candidatus Hydrogenedentota bacterium]|nr:MAG: hypothetical protein D6679_11135 [Candidatus Hydrogenedentota bacterium]
MGRPRDQPFLGDEIRCAKRLPARYSGASPETISRVRLPSSKKLYSVSSGRGNPESLLFRLSFGLNFVRMKI